MLELKGINMLLSEHIKQMQELFEEIGDVEVTMTGTFLPDGTSVLNGFSSTMPDVFESTVCSHQILETPFGRDKKPTKRVRLMWQTS